eukprot:1893557-Alexandrium_andersonii.AAC.1
MQQVSHAAEAAISHNGAVGAVDHMREDLNANTALQVCIVAESKAHAFPLEGVVPKVKAGNYK